MTGGTTMPSHWLLGLSSKPILWISAFQVVRITDPTHYALQHFSSFLIENKTHTSRLGLEMLRVPEY
jgi:hypothetical protein